MATAAAAVPTAVTIDGQKVFDILVGLLKAEQFNDAFGRTVETGGADLTDEDFWEQHGETQEALTCAIANLWTAAFGRAYVDDNGTVTPLRGLAETEAQEAYDRWLIRSVARLRVEAARNGMDPFPGSRTGLLGHAAQVVRAVEAIEAARLEAIDALKKMGDATDDGMTLAGSTDIAQRANALLADLSEGGDAVIGEIPMVRDEARELCAVTACLLDQKSTIAA